MFTLRTLPFEQIPGFISQKTCQYHHGKHHQSYIHNLNELIKNTPFEKSGLYEIITNANGAIFNNAAQIFNHDFYWDSISPKQSQPSQELLAIIQRDFGSLDAFKSNFTKQAMSIFGSGWCWLVFHSYSHKLQIIQTTNAQTPISEKLIPLLVADVWEHAYYIDHHNARAQYLAKFLDHINWEFVSNSFATATKEGIFFIDLYINSLHP